MARTNFRRNLLSREFIFAIRIFDDFARTYLCEFREFRNSMIFQTSIFCLKPVFRSVFLHGNMVDQFLFHIEVLNCCLFFTEVKICENFRERICDFQDISLEQIFAYFAIFITIAKINSRENKFSRKLVLPKISPLS